MGTLNGRWDGILEGQVNTSSQTSGGKEGGRQGVSLFHVCLDWLYNMEELWNHAKQRGHSHRILQDSLDQQCPD